MGILSFISDIFAPAVDLIDEIHVSDEERMKLRNELAKIQAQMHAESARLMTAEVKSEHFMVAFWRPMCVLILISLIVADAYGWAKAPNQIYELANLFLATYAGGRSIEKITKSIKG